MECDFVSLKDGKVLKEKVIFNYLIFFNFHMYIKNYNKKRQLGKINPMKYEEVQCP